MRNSIQYISRCKVFEFNIRILVVTNLYIFMNLVILTLISTADDVPDAPDTICLLLNMALMPKEFISHEHIMQEKLLMNLLYEIHFLIEKLLELPSISAMLLTKRQITYNSNTLTPF